LKKKRGRHRASKGAKKSGGDWGEINHSDEYKDGQARNHKPTFHLSKRGGGELITQKKKNLRRHIFHKW